MKHLKHPTGRTYDAPQVLEIAVEEEGTRDAFGLREVVATFTDDSRHIKGRVKVIALNDEIGDAVLAAYDRGQYQAI
jgi:hypothetical protein